MDQMPTPELPKNNTPNPDNTMFPNSTPPMVDNPQPMQQPQVAPIDVGTMPQAPYGQPIPQTHISQPPQGVPLPSQGVPNQAPAVTPQGYVPQAMPMETPDAPNLIVMPSGTTIVYPDYNEEYARMLTEGVDPQTIDLNLFPENKRAAVIENMKGILVGGDEDDEDDEYEEEGLEIIKQKHLRTFRLKKNSGGTKGVFQVKHGEDYLTVPSKDTVEVCILARGTQRQYRANKDEMNNTPPNCTGYHTGKPKNQIPALFNDPGTNVMSPRMCTERGCAVHPLNPRAPRAKRCQSSFVYILVMRHDMTQVLRMFEPMKNYKNDQQKKFIKAIKGANQANISVGQSFWLTLTGAEFSIPKSQFSSAVMTMSQGSPITAEEAAILNMWQRIIAVPFLEGSKTSQFIRVKNAVDTAKSEGTVPSAGQLQGGVQF